jgi:ribosomal protein S6--L-glutamate ligase
MSRPPRIAFLLNRPKSANSTSRYLLAMRALRAMGATVDVIAGKGRLIDLASVRTHHDLYVLKKGSGIPRSLAGALHAQGATTVNPYPVTIALHDKIVATRILQSAGVPTPATYVASREALLAPLLEQGPLVIKPYDGSGGYGVRVVHEPSALSDDSAGSGQILAQRYHPPDGRDLKIYVIGGRVFGVEKEFPARTEEEKHGRPFSPTAEQRDLALRCGEAFGIDLYGVDLIESEGRPYVVDMGSLPGFKGVPDAGTLLARYFYRAAERARDDETPSASSLASSGVVDVEALR